MPDLSGKTALVTGATSGLGFEVSLDLARQGAKIVFGVRNLETGKHRKADLLARVPTAEVLLPDVPLDVGDPDSVQAFAGWYLTERMPLHILINNAGVSFLPKAVYTSQGVGLLAQTNYLGPYALTRLLEKRLVEFQARVVNVSSVTHRLTTIQDPHTFLHDCYTGRYQETKLAQVLFTYEMQRRLGKLGVQCAAADPGGVRTGIWEHSAFTRNPPISWLVETFYAPPADGAITISHAASMHWPDDVRDWVQPVKVEEDLRYYAKGLFASPIITAWDGIIHNWDLSHFVTAMSWRNVAAVGSLLDYPIRKVSSYAFGAQPRLVRSSMVTYDRKLAEDLWVESAKVVGIPAEPQVHERAGGAGPI